MAQNREPPAFQEYASSILANRHFRVLSLAERGLWHTIRLECWVNHSVPSDPATLARVIGFNTDEVRNGLPSLMPFFTESNGSLFCPELDDYRAHLEGQKQKQREGGKKGAEKTNARFKTDKSKAAQGFDVDPGKPQVTRELPRESLVKSSSVQFSKAQPPERDVSPAVDPWLSDYEKASNGY